MIKDDYALIQETVKQSTKIAQIDALIFSDVTIIAKRDTTIEVVVDYIIRFSMRGKKFFISKFFRLHNFGLIITEHGRWKYDS